MTVVLFFIGIYTGVINKSVVDMLWLNWSHILVVSEILAFGLSLIFYLKGWIWKQVLLNPLFLLLHFFSSIHFLFCMKLATKQLNFVSLFLWFVWKGYPKHIFVLDFFYGYEVNPRFFGIIWSDVKWLIEGRGH